MAGLGIEIVSDMVTIHQQRVSTTQLLDAGEMEKLLKGRWYF
jgi:hypothetical protein